MSHWEISSRVNSMSVGRTLLGLIYFIGAVSKEYLMAGEVWGEIGMRAWIEEL